MDAVAGFGLVEHMHYQEQGYGRVGDIERLCATVDEICRFIDSLPEAAVVEHVWGPKEVLAHFVFHHESYIDQVKVLRNGEPFEPPRGRFSDLNAQAVADSRGVSVGCQSKS